MKRGRILLLIVISFILGAHFALGVTEKTVSTYGLAIYLSYAILLVATFVFILKSKGERMSESSMPDTIRDAAITSAGWHDAVVGVYSPKNKHGHLSGFSDEELFHRFDKQVRSEKSFLNYNLGRDDYMRIMGVNKNRFGNIIKKFVGGNITAYLNELRLEYSTQLLLGSPDMPVSEVAHRSAFPNLPTYYRLFKEKFGCSPTSYRHNK